MTDRSFTLTADHITLLRHANIGWCGDEWGAPEIDPKRPYGNGDVHGDVYELLRGEIPAEWEDDGMPGEIRDEMFALHRETETALQVILATGSFVPGVYVASAYGRNWRAVPVEASPPPDLSESLE